jgi:hypothetical protein
MPSLRELSVVIVGLSIGGVALLTFGVAGSVFESWRTRQRLSRPGLTYGDLETIGSGGLFNSLIDPLFALLCLIAVATAGCFLAWQYRARRNVDRLDDAATGWGWGWSVVAWLVPLFNLVLPAVVVAETARESFPATANASRRRATWLVWAWWVVLLGWLGWFGYQIGTSATRGVTIGVVYSSPSDPVNPGVRAQYAELLGRVPTLLEVLSVLVPAIAVAALTCMLVRMVTSAQENRAGSQ